MTSIGWSFCADPGDHHGQQDQKARQWVKRGRGLILLAKSGCLGGIATEIGAIMIC